MIMKPYWLGLFVSVMLLTACGEKSATQQTTATPPNTPKPEIEVTSAPKPGQTAAAQVLNAQDQEKVKQLQGSWQSEEEKGYQVTMKDGKWMESFDDQVMPEQTYEYQPKCADGDGSKPCLLVKGEFDATFYNVLKQEPNALVIQMSEMDPIKLVRKP